MPSISNFFDAVSGKPFKHILLLNQDNHANAASNQRIWSLFVRTVKEGVSQIVIERAEKRYGFSLNENNTCPLLVKHVLAIETAIADVRFEEFNELKCKEQNCKQIFHAIKAEKPAYKLYGGYEERTLRNILLLDRLEMDRKRLGLFDGIENLSKEAFYERLAKAIVSHPSEVGMLIPAPDGKGGREYYHIAYRGGEKGLEAWALTKCAENSALEPIIVFQPTQPGVQKQGLFTLVNDAEPDLGALGYQASKPFLESIIKDARFSQGNLTITGYSLGGAHAQRFLSDYPQFCSQAIFFNDPSPRNEAVAKKFAETVNAVTWNKPIKIILYRSALVDEKTSKRCQDWTIAFGKYHVGYGVSNPLVEVDVREIEYITKNTSLFKRHVKRVLDINPDKKERFSFTEVSKDRIHMELDNTQRKGIMRWLETFRYRFISFFIYPVLMFFSSLSQKILRCFLRILFISQ